jgi:hypothetical protein
MLMSERDARGPEDMIVLGDGYAFTGLAKAKSSRLLASPSKIPATTSPLNAPGKV